MSERTDSHATTNCSTISSANARIPSASATSLDNSTVASVEPSATVTTKSKAFIFVSVRFPAARSNRINAAYAQTAVTAVLTISIQLSKNMSSFRVFGRAPSRGASIP